MPQFLQCLPLVFPNVQVTEYFRRTSSKGERSDWQFRQMVDAIQLLLIDLEQVSAAKQVDWDYWREAVKPLGVDHPTVAKEWLPGHRVAAKAVGPTFSRSAEAFPVLECLARAIRSKHYSIRTEQAYVDWCHRFLRFCGDKPLDDVVAADVKRFLSYLAVEKNVAASTQSVALNAVVFLFKQVLERPLDGPRGPTRGDGCLYFDQTYWHGNHRDFSIHVRKLAIL